MSTQKMGFWEQLQYIVLDSVRLFLQRLGPVGAFLLIIIYVINSWASDQTKDKLIRKYILGADKYGEWISHAQARTILEFLLIVGCVLIIVIFRRREKKLWDEISRITAERNALQEGGLGPLEHSD